MTKENEENLKGFEKFQARTLELAGGDQDKATIANKLSEMELDFEFVKDLNTQLANKYQELLECFPTAREIANTIAQYEKMIPQTTREDDLKVYGERIIKLKKFKSALVALEAQDPLAKPQRYDELFNQEKVN